MKVKPKKLNTNGMKYASWKKRELILIRNIDRKKNVPDTRDVMEYPKSVNETGRLWRF